MSNAFVCRTCDRPIYVLPEEDRQDDRVWAHKGTGLLSCGPGYSTIAFALPKPPERRVRQMPPWVKKS